MRSAARCCVCVTHNRLSCLQFTPLCVTRSLLRTSLLSPSATGEVAMTRGKYNWVRFGTPVRVPRAAHDCAVADPDKLPLSCDRQARAAGVGRSSSVVAHTERTWLAALPDRDPFTIDTVKWRSCALVSNSGALLLERRGVQIDTHDAVFRLNDGPTAGFEPYVGTKTTVRVLSPAHLGFREEKPAHTRESHSPKEARKN